MIIFYYYHSFSNATPNADENCPCNKQFPRSDNLKQSEIKVRNVSIALSDPSHSYFAIGSSPDSLTMCETR